MIKTFSAIALVAATNAINLESMAKPVKDIGTVGGNGKGSTSTSTTSTTVNTYSLTDGITEGVVSVEVNESVGAEFIVCVTPCGGCMYPWVKVTSSYTNITATTAADD